MKNKLLSIFLLLFTVVASFVSCKDDESEYPNSLDSYPIRALIFEAENTAEDGGELTVKSHTFSPEIVDGVMSKTFTFSTPSQNDKISINKMVLNDNVTANIAEGDIATFTKVESDDSRLFKSEYELEITDNGKVEIYTIVMTTPVPTEDPAIVYVINSGAGYAISENSTLASPKDNGMYEGLVYIPGDWINVGLVSQNLLTIYDAEVGNTSTYETFTMKDDRALQDDGTHKSGGPWGPWNLTGDVGLTPQGAWFFTFDVATLKMSVMATLLAIDGTASASGSQVMTYSGVDNIWTLKANLSIGSLKFTTLAMTISDPVLTFGDAGAGVLTKNGGNDISISEAGTYTITVDFSDPFAYKYTVVLEPPVVIDPAFVYVVSNISSPKYGIAETDPISLASIENNGKYEGFVYIAEEWVNIGLVSQDKQTIYEIVGGNNSALTFEQFTLNSVAWADKAAEGGSFPSEGPWGPWFQAGTMTSQKAWFFTFDNTTLEMSVMATLLAIDGTASSSGSQVMIYSGVDNTWTLETALIAGNLKFTTLAMTAGDPVLTFGESATGVIAKNIGNDIVIAADGTYTIVVDFSNPVEYTYTIIAK